MRYFFATVMAVTVIAGAASAQHRNRTENEALLGVVTQPAKAGVEVMHVLERSPAAKAKLKAGDVIALIGEERIKTNWDLDDALAKKKPGEAVEIGYIRGKKRTKTKARLIERDEYRGDFLDQRGRGATGFDAPPWYAYAWSNIGKGRPAPTRENTKGKVVVFHTFQSW